MENYTRLNIVQIIYQSEMNQSNRSIILRHGTVQSKINRSTVNMCTYKKLVSNVVAEFNTESTKCTF